jgi:probable HAF family extracellular repeat protein/autotransporter-associated beta strand protein
MIRSAALGALVAAAIMAASAEAQLSYTLIDLGVLTGTDAGVAGVASGGRVAIADQRPAGLRSFVWQSGTSLDIGTLGGATAFAHGISFNTGLGATQVVGNSTLASGSSRGFLWTQGGTGGVAGNPQMRDLGTLGGTYSDAIAVNATGRVTGYSENAAGRERAFLWNSGTMSDLGATIQSRLGLTWSYGSGINGLNRVVGHGYNDAFDAAVGWFYNGTTVRDLGDLGGGDAWPVAINDADQIVGYSLTAAGFERAFLMTGSTTMRSLGTLGGQSSYAVAINNAGTVVGSSFADPADTLLRAFVTVSGTMQDLTGYLDTSGQGWTLEEATGITSAGQIVGVAMVGGTTHGFLASPSAPALTWSVSGTQPGGTGTWSGTATTWLSGTSRTTWTGTSKGVFAGAGAAVTVSGTLATSGGLEFRSGTTTLSGGTLALLPSALGTVPIVSVSGSATASIGTTVTGSTGLLKSGSGILVLRGTNTLTGPVTVQTGTLRLATTTALQSGTVVMCPDATLRVGSLLQVSLVRLDLTAGGKIDVNDGTLTVGSGLTPVSTVAEILEGRGDGTWNGENGITSTAVAAAVAASVPRAIGWLDNGDGSITTAFSAPGDTNIDGAVDILDGANFLAGGKFDSGEAASWNEGDFGYDGLVDILDAADFLSTGLFDAGPYITFAAAPVAAVPEPAVAASAAAAAVFMLARRGLAPGRASRTNRRLPRRPA